MIGFIGLIFILAFVFIASGKKRNSGYDKTDIAMRRFREQLDKMQESSCNRCTRDEEAARRCVLPHRTAFDSTKTRINETFGKCPRHPHLEGVLVNDPNNKYRH
ncbi:MAG: hypothetical protein KAS32_03340 [Candidatus Peribacteraceae bacterium]|nr:hypothetical protein [Candidatus Peribacteraceae bacterium]